MRISIWLSHPLVKQLLNSAIARYRDLFVSRINYLPQPSTSANNWSTRHWQTTKFGQPRPILVNSLFLESDRTLVRWRRPLDDLVVRRRKPENRKHWRTASFLTSHDFSVKPPNVLPLRLSVIWIKFPEIIQTNTITCWSCSSQMRKILGRNITNKQNWLIKVFSLSGIRVHLIHITTDKKQTNKQNKNKWKINYLVL